MLFFIHFNSGYLGAAWCSWLSGSCLTLLAIRVLVLCSWLSGYCLMLLAIWVLFDALGYQHFTFCLNWSLSNVILYSFNSGYLVAAYTLGYLGLCLTLLAIRVLSDTLGYLGTVWRLVGHPGPVPCSWLSGYCLMLLAINISLFAWTYLCQMLFFIHFNSGYLGAAWCSWLSGSLSDTLGYLDPVWCSWLSGSWVTLLAIRVLCDALGYTGTVWHSWLSTFHFLPELIFVKCYSLFHFNSGYPGAAWCSWLSGSFDTSWLIRVFVKWHSWLSGYCLTLLAIWVLSWCSWLSRSCLTPLAINISLFAWTDICQMLFFIHLNSGYLGAAWCSWLSGYFVWHSWLSGSCLMFLAIRVLSDALGYQHFTFCLNWSLSNVILYSF